LSLISKNKTEIMKLAELAKKTFSTIENGDGDMEISAAAGLDIAQAGQVTFLANLKYTPQIAETKASAIFLNDGAAIERSDIAVLRARDSYVAYTRALRLFHPQAKYAEGIHPSASVHETARIAPGVSIDAFVSIGANCVIASGVKLFPGVAIYEGVFIGSDTVIHSGTSVRENCVVGERVIIHNNVTVGCDGFGFAKDEDKHWLKIPQAGRVVIEDDVEIGAGTTIDCASVGETRICRGVKIDNLVQIGHSCFVDEDALICAQTGLAGSSHIGKRVILAGQVGIAGHLKVGDDAVITAKSATSHDVEPGTVISGIPGFDNRDWLRSTAAFRRLGEMVQRIRELEKRLTEFEGK
jgi:UDP-3-O-[3-hydroxymyristoyl] glucosamine N-acyltransferase